MAIHHQKETFSEMKLSHALATPGVLDPEALDIGLE